MKKLLTNKYLVALYKTIRFYGIIAAICGTILLIAHFIGVFAVPLIIVVGITYLGFLYPDEFSRYP